MGVENPQENNRTTFDIEKVRNMSLDDVLNTVENPEFLLERTPFSITIKYSGDLRLFKYNMLNTDMSYLPARGCRGSIYRKEGNTYKCVCRPFDKFFNVGEAYASEIDWKTAKVTEKVDGSLMKVFYDNGNWKLATNGTIDAFVCRVGDTPYTFGTLFLRAVGCTIEEMMEGQDTSFTYMFELTSPESRVVVPYEDGVYYLARRKTDNGKENFQRPEFLHGRVLFPRIYSLSNLEDVQAVVQSFTKDEEGVVVHDAKGRRIKVKSPAYLMATHLRVNDVSDKIIVRKLQQDILDDFLAYNPHAQRKVDKVLKRIKEWEKECEKAYDKVREQISADRKTIASIAQRTAYPDYVFWKLDNTEKSFSDYIARCYTKTVLRSIQQFHDFDEVIER